MTKQEQMTIEERKELAKALIERNPTAAAFHIARLEHHLAETEATLRAVQAFSQNRWLALHGSKKQIEDVLYRTLDESK